MIIIAAFLAVITISIVIGFYFAVWKDLWRPIIRINDETINMDYVLRRMKYPETTSDITAMLTVITEEEFIRQGAPRYGIEVTPDEIDERLRDIARGSNATISESEFKAWYHDQLSATQLSDAEFRELTRTYMLAERLNEYLGTAMSVVAEQVHVYVIFLGSSEDAWAAIDRFEDGEDFSELARELSLDEETAEQGGDFGWWPEGGGLHENLEYWAFVLEVGQVSEPTLIDEDWQIYAICLVTEREDERPVEEEKLEVMKAGGAIFEKWLNNEWTTYILKGEDIWLNLSGGTFDDYTLQWISLKLLED
ncbi:MAG TPA: peptidylprolyl isomerase [Dehalococcoidia bacterium]|nr:peptidylprolyl isomerase [Dehalococcoidia bacterium]